MGSDIIERAGKKSIIKRAGKKRIQGDYKKDEVEKETSFFSLELFYLMLEYNLQRIIEWNKSNK